MAASEIPSVATVSRRRLNGLGMLGPLGVIDTLLPLDIEYIASVERATHACRAVSRRVEDEPCLAPEINFTRLVNRRWRAWTQRVRHARACYSGRDDPQTGRPTA